MKKEKSVKDPRSEAKKTQSFAVSFLLGFVLFFYSPVDIYLSNLGDILLPFKYIVLPAFAVTAVFIAVFSNLLMRLEEKVYIRAVNIMTGLSAAFYFQGNFLQISAGELDGTGYRFTVLQAAANLIIWAACIALPFVIYRFADSFHNLFINVLTVMIQVMGFSAIIFLCAGLVERDIDNVTDVLVDCLTNKVSPFVLSSENKFDFSEDHNIIVFLADEYDSFAFDTVLEEYPETAAEMHDFTYYRDTLGMYGYSSASFNFIFGNKIRGEEGYSTELFETLRNNGYTSEMFTTIETFPQNVFSEYADNYKEYRFTAGDLARLNLFIYRLSLFKISPVLMKPLFYATSAEITKSISPSSRTYYPDNLSFYNSLPDEFTLSGTKRYKFFYIYGLHIPLNINKDLERVSDDSVSPEEEGVAVNKIISRFLSLLRKSGAYDNSDIIILADHGIKTHDNGKYPLLMIKRAGEHHDEINISDVNVSYADLYPTLLYLAGDSSGLRTVFDLTEDDNKERYYADTDEYIIGDIK